MASELAFGALYVWMQEVPWGNSKGAIQDSQQYRKPLSDQLFRRHLEVISIIRHFIRQRFQRYRC